MKRKIFSTLLALVLVLTLGLVMAVPVAATEPIDLAVNGENPWTSKAFTFTDVLPGEDLAPFSVKFENVGSNEGVLTFSISYVENDMARAPAPNMSADEFARLVYVAAVTQQYFCEDYGPEGGGIHDDLSNWLGMDAFFGNEDGKLSLYELMLASPIPWATEENDTLPAGEASKFVITFCLAQAFEENEGVAYLGLMSDYTGDYSLYMGDPVVWNVPQGDGVDVTVSATLEDASDPATFDIEESSGNVFQAFGVAGLDKDFYKIGDEPIVTIYDAGANDPMAIDDITVHVASNTDTTGDEVTLVETGSDTGIFDGSFTLLGEPPADRDLDQIVVEEVDIITLTYNGVEVATAIVDEEAPEFVSLTDGLFYNNGDTITLTATLDAADYTVTADFSAIDSEYAAADVDVVPNGEVYTITYTIDEANTTGDGTYFIPVTAEDLAGNSTTDASFSTTLDNTGPAVSESTASPAVLQPDVATIVTFTASVSDALGSGVATVTIDLSDPAIGGGAAEEMVEGKVEEEGTGIYTCDATLTVALEDEGNYELVITATDNLDNVNDTEAITLRVIADGIPPVIVSTEVEYPVGAVSARVGDDVVVIAVVTDDLVGVDTVMVDATGIGIEAPQTMDPVPGITDTYSATLTVGDTTAGTKTLTITAADLAANDALEASVDVEVVISLTGYNIALLEGWNLVSLPLIPTSSAITDVLADLITAETVDWVDTFVYEDGLLVEKKWDPPAILQNTVMNAGQGYWINMTAGDTLAISGLELPAPPNVPPTYKVYEGWNLIGVKSVNPIDVSEYLGSAVTATLEVIYSYDATNGVYELVLVEHQFVPGCGYWLAVNANGTIYP